MKPLVGGAACFVSPPQLARRHAGSAVFGGEQHLHVLADGFVGAVLEHPLRPGIPRIDDALAAHREDGVFERAVDEQAQALLATAQIVFGLTALADVLQRDDHAIDPIVCRTVWPQPDLDPAPVAGVTLTVDDAQLLDHALQVVEEVGIAQIRGDVGERAAQIGSQQVEHDSRGRCEQLHPQAAIEEDRADIAGVDQVLKVVVREPELFDLDLELLVDRRQLLVDRLQLFLAGLELLCRRAQLLVHRLELFVRRLGLFDLGLVLLDGDAQLLAQPADLLFELLRQRLRRPGQLPGRRLAHRFVGVERDEQVAAGRFLFAQDRVDADVNQVRAVVEHGLHGPGFDVAAVEDRLVQRCAQFRAQVGPRHADQVARRFAAGDLEETADPLGQVHDVVVLGRDERRRSISLEQALVQLARRNPFGGHPACADTREWRHGNHGKLGGEGDVPGRHRAALVDVRCLVDDREQVV